MLFPDFTQNQDFFRSLESPTILSAYFGTTKVVPFQRRSTPTRELL